MSWKNRAKYFNKLEWATDKSYLDALIKAGAFNKTHAVLDVGTGTGIVAQAIAPLVKEVIGLDKSPEMLNQGSWNNVCLIRGDIRQTTFENGIFDRVIARHVFRHIVDGTQRAAHECFRVLKKGGIMVLSEGVPPSPESKEDYIRIFKLKGNRLVFMEDELIALMKRAGFTSIQLDTVWLRRMSVRNWLANSGLPERKQGKIFQLYDSLTTYRRDCNMVEGNDDRLIDMKMAIVTGKKEDI